MSSVYNAARNRLIGPIVPLNIPFTADGEIDYDNVRTYVDWLVTQGVPIVMLTYGSSEYVTLTDTEIYDITRVVGETVAGRAVYLAAANYWPVREIIRYVEHARRVGADAVSIQPNWYSPLDEADVFEFHRQVADTTRFPLLSYTVASPGMSPALVARFAAELPAVIGLKNDSDQFYAYYDYLRAANGRLTIISGGQMRNIFFGYQFGSRAYLCGMAPFAPWISNTFFGHLATGELAAAANDTLRYEAPLLDVALRIRGNWLPFIKSVLYLRGLFRTNRLRLPYPTHRPDELSVIEAMLAHLSIDQ